MVLVLFIVSLLTFVIFVNYVFWFKLEIARSSGLAIWQSILQGRFILPWITVAVGYAAFYARMVRGNMTETMSDDFPMMMGVTVLGALFIAVANLVVDVAYAFLDPRVRDS